MASDTRSTLDKNGKKREKVMLQPGFHLADWVRLTKSATNLSGLNGQPLRKISLKELQQHNTQFDCWTAYNGKVYNITNYLPYHPGGVPKLMLGAGKDCTALFNRYHQWVNCHSMLSKCLIGTLIEEHDAVLEEGEDCEEQEPNMKAVVSSEKVEEGKEIAISSTEASEGESYKSTEINGDHAEASAINDEIIEKSIQALNLEDNS